MSIESADPIALDAQYCIDVYNRQPLILARGEGCRVWDTDGKRYLDWVAGIAVDILGHSHPAWVAAVQDQAARLAHISNLYYNEFQPRLAQELARITGLERAFFTNSGTEANEAAIKIARKWGKVRHGEHCFRIVTYEKSFHGRTYGGMSATGQAKYQKPFTPLVPGFVHVPMDDFDALDRELDGTVCAVMVETVQGEGGLRAIPADRLQAIRDLCTQREVLLIVDEVQCGMGRTGKWMAYQHAGILPDLVPLAKGLGAGFPIGACVARGEAATVLGKGEHGSTFAGGPLATRVGLTVIETLERERIIENAATLGAYLRSAFSPSPSTSESDAPTRSAGFSPLVPEGFGPRAEESDTPTGCDTLAQGGTLGGGAPQSPSAVSATHIIKEIRGLGLMIGFELAEPIARQVVADCRAKGLLINAVSDTTLRIVPPLILTRAEADEGVDILRACLS